MQTNADLLRGYIAALAWGNDCRDRHAELARAVEGAK